jgi:co-chaperonin GroES (HSP10)
MAENIKLIVYGDRLVVVYDDFVDTMVFKKPDGKEFAMKAPDTHSERTRGATVMAVGDDEETQRNFKVGDRLLLSWHSGTRLHLMDKIVYGRTWPEDLLRVIRTEEILTKTERIDGPDNIRGCEDATDGPVQEPNRIC